MTGERSEKWRPGLGLVLILVLGTALVLPLVGLSVLHFDDNRLLSFAAADLLAQRTVLFTVTASVLLVAGLIGFVLYRAISQPVGELIALSQAVATGERVAIRPLRHHGTREFAALSRAFIDMAARLTRRSDAVSSYAAHVSHELKSPLTAIRGAAELLRDDLDDPRMDEGERRRFLDNIMGDAVRLDALLQRLREMARAEAAPAVGTTTLAPVVESLRQHFPTLDIHGSGDLDVAVALSVDDSLILLSHLADNAGRHGAVTLDITATRRPEGLLLTVDDDGSGISSNNKAQVFESFFTTRRESGGTGMGLAIVKAMLEAQGGSIALRDRSSGAGFALSLPPASSLAGALPSAPPNRAGRIAVVFAIVLAGLALRGLGPGAGLPFAITKYGGSVLWGAMIYGIGAALAPAASRRRVAASALTVAVLVEVSRALHTPWLDDFRLTVLGALLLGRVFAPCNVLAYATGIAAGWSCSAAVTDRRVFRLKGRQD